MADEPGPEEGADAGPTWATGAEDYVPEEEPDGAEDNPHFLPPFANEYNREVSRVVKHKEERQIAVTRDLDDQNERVRVMDEHLGNVKQELTHTQALAFDPTHNIGYNLRGNGARGTGTSRGVS